MGDTRVFTIHTIGVPVPYDTDNVLYKYIIEHSHVRDVILLPVGDIEFEG